MSETPAARARSVLFQPRNAISAAIRSTLNRGLGCFVPTTGTNGIDTIPTVSIPFSTKYNAPAEDRFTLGEPVPKRPQISAPKFGAWLQLQRGKKRSLAQVALKIRPLVEGVGLKVSPSLIHKIERGRVPSWPMLAAFSRVYGVPIVEILQRLSDAIEFSGASDLLRHGTETASVLHGGPDVPAFDVAAYARIQQLEQQLSEREAFIDQTQNAARALWGMYLERVTAAEEGRPPRAAKRRRRGAHRKTG